jgi:Heterokaryon incompatibility protein (HET)
VSLYLHYGHSEQERLWTTPARCLSDPGATENCDCCLRIRGLQLFHNVSSPRDLLMARSCPGSRSVEYVSLESSRRSCSSDIKGKEYLTFGDWGPSRYVTLAKVEDYANFGFARQSLSDCSTEHGISCGSKYRPASLSLEQRAVFLIDVYDMCLVPASNSEGYVALSYRWGSGTRAKEFAELSHKMVPEFQKRGFFRSHAHHIPTTINDAIEFTRKVGKGIFGLVSSSRQFYDPLMTASANSSATDRYCIIQDDKDIKYGQLQAMSNIYHAASFTIIAAEGDASSGLPGMRHQKRATNPQYCPNADILIAASSMSIMDGTPWAKRGWVSVCGASIINHRNFMYNYSLCNAGILYCLLKYILTKEDVSGANIFTTKLRVSR